MSGKDQERLHPRIDRKLARVVRSSPVPPSWQEPWSRLGPESTQEQRLEAFQAIRDSATVPKDAGYFLVSWQVENLAAEVQEKLRDPLQTLNMFEARRTSDRIFTELLERHGERKTAKLFLTDSGEHDRRREAGRQFFFGSEGAEAPQDPAWLEHLLRAVAYGIVAPVPAEGLSCRYRQDGDYWEVHVLGPSEGGRDWAVDIERLREQFDRIDGCGWYAVPAGQGDSPYAWIEGMFQEHEVFLRVLPEGPWPEDGTEYQVWRRSGKEEDAR